MNYEDFICLVRDRMQERLGEEAAVALHRITKNNGVVLDGLSVSVKGSDIAPTIYLNDFYRDYQEGVTIPEIQELLGKVYERSKELVPFDTEFYKDFSKVRDHLACRLVNYRKNRELLKRVPHKRFLDLAMVAYCCYEEERLGTGTILVYESHLKSWNITPEELLSIARENTRKILPERFMDMARVVEGRRGEEMLLSKEEEAVPPEKEKALPEIRNTPEELQPMYVLTNRTGYFGAASILFDAVLEKVGEFLDGNYWILPSSVHECIIVPESVFAIREELKEMVWEINRTEVSPEEYLSDEIYFYCREFHRLSLTGNYKK